MCNNNKENKKDRKIRLREFNVAKLSDIIQFLNKKTHESITIIEKINNTINHQGVEIDLLFFYQKWNNINSFPQEYSIINHIVQLENKVLLAIKLHLVCHPYLALLSDNTQNSVNILIKHIDTILNLDKDVEVEYSTQLSTRIDYVQTVPNFPQFLIDRNIISTDIVDDGNTGSYFAQKEDVITKFEELENQKQLALKVNYLKERIKAVNQYSDKWKSIPDKIEYTIKILSKEFYILVKS